MATKPRHLKTEIQLWVADNRKRLGLTPADLASLTGVTEDTARGWESRGSPSQDALDILVRRFGVPLPMPSSGGTPLPELGALIEAQTAALERQTAAFLTLAASIDRATGHVIQRVDDVADALVDLGEVLRTPAKDGNGDAVGDAPAPSGGHR